jgi:hypothetical protein
MSPARFCSRLPKRRRCCRCGSRGCGDVPPRGWSRARSLASTCASPEQTLSRSHWTTRSRDHSIGPRGPLLAVHSRASSSSSIRLSCLLIAFRVTVSRRAVHRLQRVLGRTPCSVREFAFAGHAHLLARNIGAASWRRSRSARRSSNRVRYLGDRGSETTSELDA